MYSTASLNAPPISIDELVDDVLGLNDSSSNAPVWQPFPNSPQARAYESKADIIGYGGAAGGGKSDLALGLAFTKFYKSIIFRREHTQLKDLVMRGDAIQDGRCVFVSGEKKRWTTPDGRMVELGAAQYERDVAAYKGRPRDLLVIDEAADFTEYQVRFLSGWLRTDRPEINPLLLLTFNPPTSPEGEWIVKYFAPWIDPNYTGTKAEPGELRWYIRHEDKDVEVDSGEPVVIDDVTYYPQSRTFFRALVEDNPVYVKTGYAEQLESLPEPLRSQLRYGDFDVAIRDDIWQAIPTQWIIDAQNRWLKMEKPELSLKAVGVDPSRGGADETVISKLYGTWFAELIAHQGRDVQDGIIAARYVTDAMGEEKAPIFVDVIGIGASVYDHLKVLSGTEVHPVNVGEGSQATDKTGRYGFTNLRSEIVWKFREALDPASGENIALPPDSQLRTDLRAPRYSIVGGKIKVESKEDIKKRIGRSPDDGDSVLITWHGANQPALIFDVW